MSIARTLGLVGISLLLGVGSRAQQPADGLPPASADPLQTLHTTTQLVVLDATVFDRQGRIVNAPLGRDDFQVEEDRKPQAIRYFESTQEHQAALNGGDAEKAPLLIVVLDELNFHYNPARSNVQNLMDQSADFAYMRSELLGFLKMQPSELHESTEVLALTHHGFQVLSAPTRDRDALMTRITNRNPGLGSPYRDYIEETGDGGSASFTLTKSSLQAMWSLALQERSEPGRKIVAWLGYGGPSYSTNRPVNPLHLTPMQRYTREITDLLIDARITLDLIGPGLQVGVYGQGQGDAGQMAQENTHFGFEDEFGFAGYVHATGGVFKNGNGVAGELEESQNYGSTFYTLSYSPARHDFDGEFRRIRVTVKGHSDWVVLTKGGYFAMQYGGEKDQQHQIQADLSIATYETMPFSAIGATLTDVTRVRGSESKDGTMTQFALKLQPDDLQWRTDTASGVRTAEVAVSAVALGKAPDALGSHAGTWRLTAPVNGAPLSDVKASVTIQLRVPPKTKSIRFAVRDLNSGRIGTTQVAADAVGDAPFVEPARTALQGRDPGAQK